MRPGARREGVVRAEPVLRDRGAPGRRVVRAVAAGGVAATAAVFVRLRNPELRPERHRFFRGDAEGAGAEAPVDRGAAADAGRTPRRRSTGTRVTKNVQPRDHRAASADTSNSALSTPPIRMKRLPDGLSVAPAADRRPTTAGRCPPPRTAETETAPTIDSDRGISRSGATARLTRRYP
ncbi:hypothetical protein GCM10022207_27570 [Streptomyces lannensis]|uniref:Uncharacterized protein n=1 Tax=Streptomyces lannensis TaxID=766498 RepID=A0ABP7K1B1_9ACTN